MKWSFAYPFHKSSAWGCTGSRGGLGFESLFFQGEKCIKFLGIAFVMNIP
jgi:hypothetical protein